MANEIERQNLSDLSELVIDPGTRVYVIDTNKRYELESTGAALDGTDIVDAPAAQSAFNDPDLRFTNVADAQGGGGGLPDPATGDPGDGLQINGGGTAWEVAPPYVSTLTGLADTPSNYTGNGGKVLAVNGGETGVEFVTGGGTSFVAPDNVVTVNSKRAEVAGESYQTFSAAKAYVLTQTPTVNSQWGFKMSGVNGEAISLDEFMHILGEKGVTKLTGAVTSSKSLASFADIQNVVIKDCIVENLATTADKLISFDNCRITGGTPAGGIIVSFNNTQWEGGNHSGLATLLGFSSKVFGGEMPAAMNFQGGSIDNIFGAITLNGGEFYNMIFGSVDTLNAGEYKLRNVNYTGSPATFTVNGSSFFRDITTSSILTVQPENGELAEIEQNDRVALDDSLGGGIQNSGTRRFHRTVTLAKAASGAGVNIIENSEVGGSEQVYVEGFRATVNGAIAWDTITVMDIATITGETLSVSIPVAALTGNSVHVLDDSNIEAGSIGGGAENGQGIKIFTQGVNAANGDDFVFDIWGTIR